MFHFPIVFVLRESANPEMPKSYPYRIEAGSLNIQAIADVPLDSNVTDILMKKVLPSAKYEKIMCLQTPVICSEVDPDIGHVKNSEVIVERMYKYFDTYNNVRITILSLISLLTVMG